MILVFEIRDFECLVALKMPGRIYLINCFYWVRGRMKKKEKKGSISTILRFLFYRLYARVMFVYVGILKYQSITFGSWSLCTLFIVLTRSMRSEMSNMQILEADLIDKELKDVKVLVLLL
jgi:hypothetical protein